MSSLVGLSWRLAAATFACVTGTVAIGAAVTGVFGNVLDPGVPADDLLAPLVGSNLLMVAALVFPARTSVLRGRRLYGALFLATFGINVLLVHLEAAIFLEMSGTATAASVAHATLSAAWVVLVVLWFFGRGPAPDKRHLERPTMSRLTGRWMLAAGCYAVLYFTAGMLIYPYVRTWYEAQNFTGGLWILPLQLLRGALYVAFSLVLLRSLAAPRWQIVLATAAMFPILAGVAALLMPNAIFPTPIRLWHLLEIGWSNFVFGAIVAWLFGPHRTGLPSASGVSADPKWPAARRPTMKEPAN